MNYDHLRPFFNDLAREMGRGGLCAENWYTSLRRTGILFHPSEKTARCAGAEVVISSKNLDYIRRLGYRDDYEEFIGMDRELAEKILSSGHIPIKEEVR